MRGIVFYGSTGTFTWRMLATVLAGQSVCILLGTLVARAIAASGEGPSRSTTYLVVGLGLFVLCIVGAGMLRRPWGITLGWVIQALTLLSALVVPMMLVVGLLFLALWVTCMVQGQRIDAIQAQAQAAAPAQAGDEEGEGAGGHRELPGRTETGSGSEPPADRVDG